MGAKRFRTADADRVHIGLPGLLCQAMRAHRGCIDNERWRRTFLAYNNLRIRAQ